LIAGKKVFFEESREVSGIQMTKLTQLSQLSKEELNNMEILDTITFECRTFNMYLKAGSKLFYDGQLVEGIDVGHISAKDWESQNYIIDKEDGYPRHFLSVKGFWMTKDYFKLDDKVLYKNKVITGVNTREFHEVVGFVYN
jgi:hypothetical protein